MNLDTRTRRAMLEFRASLEHEGFALMDALANPIRALFPRAPCADIAAVLQASCFPKGNDGKGETPTENARALAAQVWEILPDALRERFLNYCQRAHALEGGEFADFLAALGAPTDMQAGYE